MAWQHISPEVSVKGFKCISTAVGGIDGIDALMLWNDNKSGATLETGCPHTVLS
jgi:hypothetical protein